MSPSTLWEGFNRPAKSVKNSLDIKLANHQHLNILCATPASIYHANCYKV